MKTRRKKQPRLEMQIDWGGFEHDRASFYNYVDVTDDGVAFYVGKGDGLRVTQKHARNSKHAGIATKHGIVRYVVAQFDSDGERAALELETSLITLLMTYAHRHGIGCNFTLGGEGTRGHRVSDEERRKRSLRQTGEGNSAKDPTVRKHISESLTGKKFTEERKRNIARAKMGKKRSTEAKERTSQTMRTPEVQLKLSAAHAKRNAHLVPIHVRIVEKLNEGLKHVQIVSAVNTEMNVSINVHTVSTIKLVHKRGTCKVCNFFNVELLEVAQPC